VCLKKYNVQCVFFYGKNFFLKKKCKKLQIKKKIKKKKKKKTFEDYFTF